MIECKRRKTCIAQRLFYCSLTLQFFEFDTKYNCLNNIREQYEHA